jgi:hypothetical protein
MAAVLAIYGFCILTSFADSETGVRANPEHNTAAGIAKFIGWVGKFHPATTHFPIALIIAAAAAEVLLFHRNTTGDNP